MGQTHLGAGSGLLPSPSDAEPRPPRGVGCRGDDPGHRPGHDRLHLLVVRRADGTRRRRAPTASSRQHYPQPGWVEHDARRDLERSRATVAREALDDAGVPRPSGRDRDHEPARDRRASGTAAPGEPLHRAIVWQDRRTAQRCDELATPAHEPLIARAHRARPRPVLLGDEARVAAASNVDGLRERAAAGEAVVRHDRQLADLACSRRRSARHRSDQRVAHDAATTSHAATWNDELCALFGVPRAIAAGGPAVDAATSATRDDALPGFGGVPDQRASPATSRPRCTGRGAATPGRARTRTARARSSSINTGDPPAGGRRAAHDRRLADRAGRHAATRSRRRSSSRAPRCSGCATGWAASSARPRPRRSRASLADQRRRLLRARRSPGSARRTGTRRRAGRSSGSRAARRRAHLARAALEAIAYQAVDAVRAMEAAGGAALDRRCASTAARRPTTG